MNRLILKTVSRYWWFPVVIGILAIGLGIWVLASPDTSLAALAYTFAVVISAVGFLDITFSLMSIGSLTGWGWKFFIGIVEIVCGIWLLMLPENQMISAFIYGVGFYLIFLVLNAISETVLYYGTSKVWLAILISFIVCTLVLALIFLAGPLAGGIAVWLYIGIAFITYGFYRLLIGIRIYQANKELE
ncbi:MAG: DUF308 domain-containing protein [Bacteroidales bacterium]|nr:DUF308 domain-containing protein [Bacteroidales bacterium]